jgi:hypothetical protein
MKKGTFQKSVEVKPVQGKMDTSKPVGGEVRFGYTPAGRKGKKA